MSSQTPAENASATASASDTETPTKSEKEPRARPRVNPQEKTLTGLVDLLLITLFLGLTFVLGMFPLKDTDFWWHLRTGDLIRQTGVIPKTDIYTFTVPNNEWIDLHWGFQVALSLVYQLGGVDATTLAKCLVTTLGMAILITTRKKAWPVWVMIVAWLPALYVLSGRMYVRPETLTFLYMCCFLTIIFRWREKPLWALLLPVIEVLWVNTQGLFVLGPIVLAMGLIDAGLAPGAFLAHRKSWWRIVLPASALTLAATLVNPYFLRGALFPIELVKTMGNEVFKHQIGELTPIPLFIKQVGGFNNFPLQMHIATLVIGGLSFLLPICWWILARVGSGAEGVGSAGSVDRKLGSAGAKKKTRKKGSKKKAKPSSPQRSVFGVEPFRMLLFAAFSWLSWRATRNSHQFATVVGCVTAWNFAEWAAAVALWRKKRQRKDSTRDKAQSLAGPGFAFACLVLYFVAVATGFLYAISGEKRTIGLGEEPFWFPHAAVKKCGEPGMPERFIGFNNGHVSLFEYYYGPQRKVYIDARLEVVGPDLFTRYLALRDAIVRNLPGWEKELDNLGKPVILADHVTSNGVGSCLLASPRYRCVWFDAVAAVYVQGSYRSAVAGSLVDFAERHFKPSASFAAQGTAEELALAEALKNYASNLSAPELSRPKLRRQIVLLGLDNARQVVAADPASPAGWKVRGMLESIREPLNNERPIPRFRMPLDPLFDLTALRVTYNFMKAQELDRHDFGSLFSLSLINGARGMDEATVTVMERLLLIDPINPIQANYQKVMRDSLPTVRARLGQPPKGTWRNRGELEEIISDALKSGRAATAAALIERGFPVESRPWEWADRLATLYLHLGDPDRALAVFQTAKFVSRPAVRIARIALCHLVKDEFDPARTAYQEALAIEPKLFEAWYGLAVLEQDSGHARACKRAALAAEKYATSGVGRSSARSLAASVEAYAN